MNLSEIEEEIERLKAKRVELNSKAKMTNDFLEREDLETSISKINQQIRILEKMK